jgi:glycolate oxidase
MAFDEQWVQQARQIVGSEGVLVDREAMAGYTGDEFPLEDLKRLPRAVVKPRTEEEAARIVALCGRTKVPVTARGGGTGLAGGCVPSDGAVVLSLERLNRVLECDPDTSSITVEAGVTLSRMYEEVERMGLFFPPHPGDEGAFVGGVVATNAGGSRAVKYGTVRRFVMGLRVITASGALADLGGKIIKSSSGYDLLDLMIGSEGTLGLITRVTLALVPRPGSLATLVAPFATDIEAIRAVPAILAAGIVPCAVEFVEHSAMRCAERLLGKEWPTHSGGASLMIILDGRNEDAVLAEAESISGILERGGAREVLVADGREKQAEILALRSAMYEALRPAVAELFDTSVPRSQIAGHVERIHRLEEELGVQLPTYGHAADGNVHSHSLRRSLEDGVIGPEVPGWREAHEKVRAALYADAVSRGGVISGEHGIGIVKREYLSRTANPAALELMRSVKRALDPDSILNPGKILVCDT